MTDEQVIERLARRMGKCLGKSYKKRGDWETAVCDCCGNNPFFAEHTIPPYLTSRDALMPIWPSLSLIERRNLIRSLRDVFYSEGNSAPFLGAEGGYWLLALPAAQLAHALASVLEEGR